MKLRVIVLLKICKEQNLAQFVLIDDTSLVRSYQLRFYPQMIFNGFVSSSTWNNGLLTLAVSYAFVPKSGSECASASLLTEITGDMNVFQTSCNREGRTSVSRV